MKMKRWRRVTKELHTNPRMQLKILRAKEFQELVDNVSTSEDDNTKDWYEQRKRVRMEPRQYHIQQLSPNMTFESRTSHSYQCQPVQPQHLK